MKKKPALDPSPITEAQKRILRSAQLGYLHGGRGGWNTAQLRALEARGLCTLVAKHTWDSEWRLTDAGRKASAEAKAEWIARLSRRP